MIVVWKGRIAPGRSSAMVSWIDLLPTLIVAGGGNVTSDIDGRSFLPVLLGKETHHRREIYATHHNDGNKNIYPCRASEQNAISTFSTWLPIGLYNAYRSRGRKR